MGLLFGAIAALCFGTSDFLAARAGRIAPAAAVTRTGLLTATVLSPLLLLLAPWRFTIRDSAIAAAAGVSMATGLLLLYVGYRTSRIGVVGPTSAVMTALVPIVYDVVRGVHLGRWPLVGIALGVVALALTSYVPGGSGGVGRGALLGISSGVLFGAAFVAIALTHKAAGLTTIVVQRSVGFLYLAALLPVTGGPLLAPRGPARRYALLVGVLGAMGLAALQTGFRHSKPSLVSVAASQFATITVLAAVAFNKERLHRWQSFGVLCSAAGVALMALK